MQSNLLELNHVTITYQNAETPAVKDISFRIPEESIVCIVGESGSGKSTLIRSLPGLLTEQNAVIDGEALFKGQNLYLLKEKQLQDIRGNSISMIFQDAGQYMDGKRKIGYQFVESIRSHRKIGKKQACEMAKKMLASLSMKDPERIMNAYPFELSGGMRQRIAIAMAMILAPDLLLADEPTSALDVSIQAQVVQLMMEMREQFHTSILMVTHNIGVAAHMADYIAVMKQGILQEFGTRDEVILHPKSEYTRQILAAVPTLRAIETKQDISKTSVLAVRDVSKRFRLGRNIRCRSADNYQLIAVKQVSFEIAKGKCLALVGESGSGKSTIARMITGIVPVSEGNIFFMGQDVTHLGYEPWRQLRRSIQLVFQDPMDAFSPRMKIGTFLCEPYVNYKICSKKEAKLHAVKLLEKVELKASYMEKYPHELSGGELQRVVIARALAVHPKLLICDEITSALDATTQKEIIDLLLQLRKDEQLALLFISHDLALVQRIADHILVMKDGTVVEELESGELLQAKHEYSQKLLQAVYNI
ncbi:MAG: ABC transporter ATP-binding protein [Lachnospiraceae bacterium]|nr:ABC transporter ATP-binding protein [Lachnospiraceae bacterium]